MIKRHYSLLPALCLTVLMFASAEAQDFLLSSPSFENDAVLPSNLKCTRDGGEGLSPPLEWSSVPAGTHSFALVMQHYPRGTIEGVNDPSQYWLVWKIPAETRLLAKGNLEQIGVQGSDKDGRNIGYTPPCSPGDAVHYYSIILYALDSEPVELGDKDDIKVNWAAMMQAIEGKIIASSALGFYN